MFKKKVTVEEFEEYKEQTDKKIAELEKLVMKLTDFNKNKSSSESVVKVQKTKGRGKSPTVFFRKLLVDLFYDNDVKYIEGWFYDENLKTIGSKIGDHPLRVTTNYINEFWRKSYPTEERVEKGFYQRAIDNGVIKKTHYQRSPHRATAILPNGKTGNFVIITDEFLENFRREEKMKIMEVQQ